MDRDSVDSEESRRLWQEDPGSLDRLERWWRRHQPWLTAAGYQLRPRYILGRELSWKKAGTKKPFEEFEDGQRNWLRGVMDATRISDGAFVILKRISLNVVSEELEINKFFSSEPLASDPRNHCAAASEHLIVPEDETEVILVMPLLCPFDDPPFESFGEVVSLFTQLFEGVQFMHEHHVAHRDCTELNVMMDASGMYRHPYHPQMRQRRRDWKGKAKYHSRTLRPPRYYLIDFGLSRQYDPAKGPPLEMPLHGGDKSPPEHETYETPCNPFFTDVYYLGNLIREVFIEKYEGFEFIKPLVDDMVQRGPSKRPKMDEVVSRFNDVRTSLSAWKLRSRPVRRKEWKIVRAWNFCAHVCRTTRYVITRKPAIPDP
ncbi:hypothetical protein OF83DRAFT_637400 [Amylostereum chailletii]|nr:hypothetical protein OF83DRAFT_637400 [Amylostereum chailletii]